MRHQVIAKEAGKGSRARLSVCPRVEGLEARLVLSTVVPEVAMTSVTTNDSQSVVFEYDVNSPSLSTPRLQFGVYRSADAVFDADDRPVGSLSIATTSVGQSNHDDALAPSTAVGHHRQTLATPDAFKIEPLRPYVLVVANPSTAIGAADASARTTSLHIRTIAVVTHGGIQAEADDVTGPLWQVNMARELKAEGYDVVVKYVWSSQSRTPGNADDQGPKLAKQLIKIADNGPASDPVSIHFIGHSEGAVVNTLAAQMLQRKQSPNIERGYIKMTMLDPHSANNSASPHQYSIDNSFFGDIARRSINLFQWRAQDPYASVPRNVDDADVFWQHTNVEAANTNHGLYNLWGQTPVTGKARYYDLTGPGISHGGDFGVQNWYRFNVVPNLGEGGEFIDPTVLTGSHTLDMGDVSTKWASTASTATPAFSGTATPGARVTLAAVASGSYGWKTVAETRADPETGQWHMKSRPLLDGRYRFALKSTVRSYDNYPNVAVTPRLRLGSIAVRGKTAARLAQRGWTTYNNGDTANR